MTSGSTSFSNLDGIAQVSVLYVIIIFILLSSDELYLSHTQLYRV